MAAINRYGRRFLAAAVPFWPPWPHSPVSSGSACRQLPRAFFGGDRVSGKTEKTLCRATKGVTLLGARPPNWRSALSFAGVIFWLCFRHRPAVSCSRPFNSPFPPAFALRFISCPRSGVAAWPIKRRPRVSGTPLAPHIHTTSIRYAEGRKCPDAGRPAHHRCYVVHYTTQAAKKKGAPDSLPVCIWLFPRPPAQCCPGGE